MFDRKGDAEAFDLDLRRRQQLGPLAATVLVSRQTLGEFIEEDWWPRYAMPNLKPSTRRRYVEVLRAHLLPALGGYPLRDITPMLVEDLRISLAARQLAPASQRKVLLLLSAILRRAVTRGLIPANPVASIEKPKAPSTARPDPLAPATIERIRAQLGPRDATIVSLLAYGGLRPGEATVAQWRDLQDRTLHVQASKTGRARVVELLSPLAQDLAEWRLKCGRPADRELIFAREQERARRRASREWQLHDWQNWVQRIYQPAAAAAGVTGDMRAYRLRGSFVSLLLWSGTDLVEVAEQAGHSIATLANHYAGVIREMKGEPRVPAADAIRAARESVARAAIFP
jgi:integrase